MKMKFSQTLTLNKKLIFLTLLFVLGSYHLLMCLVKLNAFNLNEESINLFKHILTRFYHLSTMLLIGFGIIYKWPKVFNWIWLYIGFKVVYNIVTFIPEVKTALNKSLLDGVYFGVLIIVIFIILSEKSD